MTKSSLNTKKPLSETGTHSGPDISLTASEDVRRKQRQRMIAETAYYRAQQRGFQGGDPLDDWLQAEAEIDHRLLGTPSL